MTTPGIGKTRLIPTTDLNLHHKNPRRGNVEAIAGSLETHGQFRPIVVNEGTHTGRPLEVIAGNHTVKAIRQLAENNPTDPRWTKVEAYVIDVDEDQSTKIVLADNRTSDLGTYDETELLALLESVDHDLDGTGYDYDDLSDLMAATSDPTEALDHFIGQNDTENEPDGTADGLGEVEWGTGNAEDNGTPDDDSDEAGDIPVDSYLAITFSVTADERRHIRLILNHIKKREALETQVEALLYALEHINGVDTNDVIIRADKDLTDEVEGDKSTTDTTTQEADK